MWPVSADEDWMLYFLGESSRQGEHKEKWWKRRQNIEGIRLTSGKKGNKNVLHMNQTKIRGGEVGL